MPTAPISEIMVDRGPMPPTKSETMVRDPITPKKPIKFKIVNSAKFRKSPHRAIENKGYNINAPTGETTHVHRQTTPAINKSSKNNANFSDLDDTDYGEYVGGKRKTQRMRRARRTRRIQTSVRKKR